MPVFYTSQIDHKQAILGEEESRHIIKVLRMAGGDPLEMVDGKGNYYTGIISVPDPKSCQVRIKNVTEDYLHRDYYLHIAIAPPKSTPHYLNHHSHPGSPHYLNHHSPRALHTTSTITH
ncbi:MAG: 16S rRNA (uracil(1498)-N(3))-methyltransferase, partial [Candidatus Mariimomonas ferrooxydans]